MSDVALRVENLGKCYGLKKAGAQAHYRTLREELVQLPAKVLAAFRAKAVSDDYWALRGVSFEVKRGEVLGVIGRNGAGKSTLLKVLSRIVEPSEGSVDIYGRVGSLLEVGTGFHPELTGRENIFLSGAILGMRRHEVRARFYEIVEFAGIRQFVDQPVKHFSSGMHARLAFAVAAHLTAEILLIDEVLAVGDADFKQRCGLKMRELAGDGGRAIVVVSHEPALIRALCSRAILMEQGRVTFAGTPERVLARYHKDRTNGEGEIKDAITHIAEGMMINRISVGGCEGRRFALPADAIDLDVEVTGTVAFAARMELEVRLYDRDGNALAFFSPGHDSGTVLVRGPGAFRLAHRINLPRLLNGLYSLRIGVVDPNRTGWLDVPEAVHMEVEGATTRLGMLRAGTHCGWMMLNGTEVPAALENGGGA